MENSYIASGESVFELFKVKVIEAVDLAKQISLEEKVQAWQFWTDISTTLKTVTGAESVTVRTEAAVLTSELNDDGRDHSYTPTNINVNKIHEQTNIPLQTEYIEQVVSSQELDVIRTAQPGGEINDRTHTDIPVSFLTESVISPDIDSICSVTADTAINTIDSEEAVFTSETKPKRSRGRPRKHYGQRKSLATKNVSKEEIPVEDTELSPQPITNQEVIKSESETCKLCGHNVDEESETNKEINNGGNICTGCGKMRSPKNLQQQKPTRLIKDTALVCFICKQMFTKEDEFDVHINTAHADNTDEITNQSDQTDEAGEETEQNRLTEDVVVETSEESVLTGTKRSRRLSLKKTAAINDEDLDYEENVAKKVRKGVSVGVTPTCNICKAKLSSEAALDVHMRTHTGEKPFSCPVCSKGFTTKCNVLRHERTHYGDKPFKCELCDKCFTEKKSVKVHMRCHTGEKPYKCEICGRCFSQRAILQAHMDLHNDKKSHLCDYCGKTFRQKAQLRLHQQRHFNIRSFKCDHCDSCFVVKGDLDRHILKHTGERPYLCSFCPKSFTRLQYLKEHHNMHSGVKPYSCKDCAAAFFDLSAYRRHMRKHKTDNTAKFTDEKQITVLTITENQAHKDELATVLYSTNLESSNTDGLDQINVAGDTQQTQLTQSIITQNAAGEYELRFIDQPISDQTGVNSGVGDSVTQQDSGDITQCSNVTYVVREDEDGSKSLILSAEDLNRLQTDRQGADFPLAEDVDQTENVENLQPLKVSDLSQLPESFQNARILSTSTDGQTYHVTYVDSDSLTQAHHILTEDDISAMNLLPSTATQQL